MNSKDLKAIKHRDKDMEKVLCANRVIWEGLKDITDKIISNFQSWSETETSVSCYNLQIFSNKVLITFDYQKWMQHFPNSKTSIKFEFADCQTYLVTYQLVFNDNNLYVNQRNGNTGKYENTSLPISTDRHMVQLIKDRNFISVNIYMNEHLKNDKVFEILKDCNFGIYEYD